MVRSKFDRSPAAGSPAVTPRVQASQLVIVLTPTMTITKTMGEHDELL